MDRRKRGLVALIATILSASHCLAEPASTNSWLDSSRQLVYVLADDWNRPTGVLAAFEKGAHGWSAVLSDIPVTLGRKGLGLGLGLHDPNLSGPSKREGDKKAPAGVFPLEYSFGTKGKVFQGKSLFPYRKTSAMHFWVDDSASAFYNQWVDLSDGSIRKDWNSAETLRRKDGIYDLVIVVGHNRGKVVPGRGSAIFLHCWFGPGVPTIGCTAMDPGHLKTLWQWLDPQRYPVLVQGPRDLIGSFPLPEGESAAIKRFLHP